MDLKELFQNETMTQQLRENTEKGVTLTLEQKKDEGVSMILEGFRLLTIKGEKGEKGEPGIIKKVTGNRLVRAGKQALNLRPGSALGELFQPGDLSVSDMLNKLQKITTDGGVRDDIISRLEDTTKQNTDFPKGSTSRSVVKPADLGQPELNPNKPVRVNNYTQESRFPKYINPRPRKIV